MPHVVVISPDKSVAYNKKNGATNDETGITAAINKGLTLSVAQIKAEDIKIAPNPATDIIRISYTKAIKDIRIVAANGQVVLQQSFTREQNASINIKQLPAGVYNLVLTDMDGKKGAQQIVKQ